MKKFLKNNLRFILLVALTLCFAVVGGLGVFGGYAPSTTYQTEATDLTLKQTASDTVCYKLTIPEGVEVDSVWINLAGKDYSSNANETSKINFGVGFARSLSGSFFKDSNSAFSVDNTFEGVRPGEWQYLSGVGSYKTYEYVCVYTYDSLKINELAFVGKDANGKLCLLEVESVGSGSKNKFSTSIAKSAEFDVTESGKLEADLLIDEQNTFSVSNIKEFSYEQNQRFALTKKEYQLVETVRNTLDGTGDYLNESAPLGLYITAIGTSIFGYNAAGVRFMPYIFTIATIVLLYFIGTLLFNRADSALILSLLFAVCGYSLFFATVGTVMAYFVFFTLLAFYSAIKFYKKGISSKRPAKGLANILIGGIAFSLATVIKSFAVYYIIPLVIVYAIGLVRQFGAYKDRKLAYENDQVKSTLNKKDYKRKVFLTIAMFIISHFILAFIITCATYLIASSAFNAYYGVKNLFDVIRINFKGGIKVVSEASKWGYIFNYQALKFANGKYLFGNVVIAFVGVISVLTTTVYSIIHLIEAKKKGLSADVKKYLLAPFAFAIAFFITGFVLPLFKVNANFDAGYTPVIFMTMLITALYNYYAIEDKKSLFKICGKEITLSKIITAVILIASTVVFALSVSAYLGLAVNKAPLIFGVINSKVFVG